MIELSCDCGHFQSVPESSAGNLWSCPQCGRNLQLACGETLPEGAGQGDFDTYLMIVDGPDRVSQRILLGGVAAIEIGKGDDRHVRLAGQKVSRHHCALNRVDFGPSRWELEDRGSTNGTFINGNKITRQELKPGDTIQVGEYQLQFDLVAVTLQDAPVATAMTTASYGGGAALPAPPPMPAPKHPVAKSKGKTPMPPSPALAYQTQQMLSEAERPLTECDVNWVMQIRNGARMMSYAAMPVVPAFFVCGLILIVALPFSALAAGASAWFLAMKEPNVRENIFWTMVRFMLRVTGTATGLAIPLLLLGGWTESGPIALAGAFALLSVPVFLFLYLLYLAKLAFRLPNNAMAVSCIVVMIALPVSIGLMIFGAVMEVVNASGQVGSAGGEFSADVGFWIMAAALWAYISILFWFNRSFS